MASKKKNRFLTQSDYTNIGERESFSERNEERIFKNYLFYVEFNEPKYIKKILDVLTLAVKEDINIHITSDSIDFILDQDIKRKKRGVSASFQHFMICVKLYASKFKQFYNDSEENKDRLITVKIEEIRRVCEISQTSKNSFYLAIKREEPEKLVVKIRNEMIDESIFFFPKLIGHKLIEQNSSLQILENMDSIFVMSIDFFNHIFGKASKSDAIKIIFEEDKILISSTGKPNWELEPLRIKDDTSKRPFDYIIPPKATQEVLIGNIRDVFIHKKLMPIVSSVWICVKEFDNKTSFVVNYILQENAGFFFFRSE